MGAHIDFIFCFFFKATGIRFWGLRIALKLSKLLGLRTYCFHPHSPRNVAIYLFTKLLRSLRGTMR